MFRAAMGITVLLLFTAALRSDDAKDKSKEDTPQAAAAKEYDALVKEYDDAYKEFLKARRAAKTDEEIKKASEKYPDPNKFAGRFLDLAKNHAKDPVAVDALVWVTVRDGASKDGLAALDLLKKDHLDDPKIAQVCQSLGYAETPERESFLRAVLDKSKDHASQAQACYALGLHAKKRADNASEKKSEDADKLTKEAEGLFERAAGEFADVKYGRRTLGDVAKGELFELRFLGIGMVAPDIEGEDINEDKLKLSDFRGKVVLLDFWGNW